MVLLCWQGLAGAHLPEELPLCSHLRRQHPEDIPNLPRLTLRCRQVQSAALEVRCPGGATTVVAVGARVGLSARLSLGSLNDGAQ
eukprot:COSAG04_NODE_14997_length_547_cov_1.015625_1_plen_84_part_10